MRWFDDMDLDRFWRYAGPAAVVGLVLSVSLAAATAATALPDAGGLLVRVLFFGAFVVHLGTVATYRRIGWPSSATVADRGPVYWILRSIVSAALFVAFAHWVISRGPPSEAVMPAFVAVFYGSAVVAWWRYRTQPAQAPATPGPAAPPPPVMPAAPTRTPGLGAPPIGPPPPPPEAMVGPWSSPWSPPSAAVTGAWSSPVLPARSPAAQPRMSRWRFLPPVAAGVAMLAYVFTRPVAESLVGSDDRPFYVATVIGEVPAVEGDEVDAEPTLAEQAAACRNLRDFHADRSLRTELAIVDDDALLRSAELLAGAWSEDLVALNAETFLLREGGLDAARARMAQQGWSAGDREHAERYYEARAQAPSPGADERFVVYMTARTTTSSLLVRLAVDPGAERFRRPSFNRVGDTEVQRPDGTIVMVDDARCWR